MLLLNKKNFFCFNYCTFLLGLLVLIFLIIFSIIAASGIIKIPILTYLLYREPEPITIVSPSIKYSLTDTTNSFIGPKDREIGLSLTQEDLTFLVTNDPKLGKGQIAIDKDKMQYFGYQKGYQDNYFTILINLVPQIKNSEVDFVITQTKLGNLSIPNFIVNPLKNLFIGFYRDQMKVLNKIKFSRVELDTGCLLLYGKPN